MKVALIPLAWLVCFGVHSQGLNIVTNPGQFSPGGLNVLGYSCIVPYAQDEVERSLLNYLRGFGRTEKMKGYFLSTDLEGLGEEGSDVMLFGQVELAGLRSMIWLGLDSTGIAQEDFQDLSTQVEKLLLNFARKTHVEQMEKKIEYSENLAVQQGKEYRRLVNQQNTLERRVVFNQVEKQRLEEALERNRQEHTDLLERTDLTLKLQKLALEEMERFNAQVDSLRLELGEFQRSF